jgi:membrane associated rhomboid family serine protease
MPRATQAIIGVNVVVFLLQSQMGEALELFLGVTGTQAGVAHFAHLGGMLGAFFMIQLRRGKPPFAKRRR